MTERVGSGGGGPPLRWEWMRFGELGVDRLYAALALRARVFILEQGPYLDPDGLDQRSWHLLGWSDAPGSSARPGDPDAMLLAYLRVVDPGLKFTEPSVGRVINAPEVRRTGIGLVLMREGIARCEAAWPGRGIRISAQTYLERFYASLGFARVGVDYLEDGIPHLEMHKPAPAPATLDHRAAPVALAAHDTRKSR